MGGFFGGYEKDKNFVGKFAHYLKKCITENKKIIQSTDRIWQPTFTQDLAQNSRELIEKGAEGVYNMASHGSASFFDLAVEMTRLFGIQNTVHIEKIPSHSFKEKCRRPENGTMENKRLQAEHLDHMPHWKESLARYLQHPYFQDLFAEEK